MKFTIKGACASKANSRKLVLIGGKPKFIKSQAARAFVQAAGYQVPRLATPIDGDVRVTMTIHYPSRRNDLDESLVLDVMQGRIYVNDRQVKEKHIYHAIDKANPRVDVEVEAI